MNSSKKLLAVLAGAATLTGSLSVGSPAMASTHYAMSTKTITLNGKVVNKPSGFASNNTMYMPIWYVMKALDQLGIESAWDGTNWKLSTPDTMAPDLTDVSVGTGSKQILLNGTSVKKVDSIAAIDPSSKQYTQYMPVWYVMQILKRVNVNPDWNGTTWSMDSIHNFTGASPFAVIAKVEMTLGNVAVGADLNQVAAQLMQAGYLTQTASDEIKQSMDWSQVQSAGITKIGTSNLKVTKEDTTDPLQYVLEVTETDSATFSDRETLSGTTVYDWTLVRDNVNSPWRVDDVVDVTDYGNGSGTDTGTDNGTGNSTDNGTGTDTSGSTDTNATDNSTPSNTNA